MAETLLAAEPDLTLTDDPTPQSSRQTPEPGFLVPGAFVRHPGRPDWGTGQVQSVLGTRVTVNFEEAGKVVINAAVIELETVE